MRLSVELEGKYTGYNLFSYVLPKLWKEMRKNERNFQKNLLQKGEVAKVVSLIWYWKFKNLNTEIFPYFYRSIPNSTKDMSTNKITLWIKVALR